MKFNFPKKYIKPTLWTVVLVTLGLTLAMTTRKWLPHAKGFMAFLQNEKTPEDDAANDETAPAGTPDTLKLTPQAWKNIGLYVEPAKPTDYVQLVSVPAVVVARAGRSQTEIAAPMTGIVTQVHALEREIVAPGTPLFDMRLTHEDVVTAQSELLAQLQALDVANQELDRLKMIVQGVIAGKRIVEQTYERDKAKSALSTTRQSLILHGLSEEQIDNIESTRTVLKNITVVAPPFASNHEGRELQHQYHVQTVVVNRGETVNAGQLLGSLADHCLLVVEGMAFEDDAQRLLTAMSEETSLKVIPVANPSSDDRKSESLRLTVQSVADQIDQNSRALKFYLLLPNESSGDAASRSNETQFVAWKYRPGQRMEVLIPTSRLLKNKIVLPSSAVVIDGPNAFIFEQNGENFDRIDVHVLLKDRKWIVLENDGTLVGSMLAMNGAYDMHLALKNQSGGAIDPHAGHTH